MAIQIKAMEQYFPVVLINYAVQSGSTSREQKASD